jgi:hypothetical protein
MPNLNCEVITVCPECRKESVIMVNVDDYTAYTVDRVYAQDAFPYLSADQREQLISGYCGACWDKLFKPEDDGLEPRAVDEPDDTDPHNPVDVSRETWQELYARNPDLLDDQEP